MAVVDALPCHALSSGQELKMSVHFTSDIRKPERDYVQKNCALQMPVSWFITLTSYACDRVTQHTLTSFRLHLNASVF